MTRPGRGGRPRREAPRAGKRAPSAEPRELAVRILYRVETQGAFAGRLLDAELPGSGLSSRARRLVTGLVFGTIRRQLTLDWYLSRCGTSRPEDLPAWIRVILRMGVYQLLYLDGVPDFAATNEAVKLAKKFGHAGTARYTNAVMRAVLRKKGKLAFPDRGTQLVRHLSLLHSHPEWVVRRWVERFGPAEAEELLRADNEPAPLVLRTNTLRTDRASLMSRLARRGVEVSASDVCPEAVVVKGLPAGGADGGGGVGDLPALVEGFCTVQDPASMLVGHALAPQPGERVADLCAAPGGKTTHIAQLMAGKGRIVALDLTRAKVDLVRSACARLGAPCVEAAVLDAREAAERLDGLFDRVLLDAPCSNMGVLRRRPEARWRADERKLGGRARLQGELLRAAGRLVRPGGVLVYSVCSVEPEENEQVISPFLAENPQFEVDTMPDLLQPYVCADGFARTWPHKHGIDGMFICRLVRTRE